MTDCCLEEKRARPGQDELRNMVEELYRQNSAYLIRLAPRLGCFPDCAEDLVHETFLIAMRKAEALYNAENRRAWLVLVLKRRIANFLRAIEYKRRMQFNMQVLYTDAREDQLGLDTMYAGLISDDDLKLLIDFYVFQYPIKTLAAGQSINVEACKKRIQRAKDRMSAAYAAYVENRGGWN